MPARRTYSASAAWRWATGLMLFAAACAAPEATQVTVVVDAEPRLRDQAARLVVGVYSHEGALVDTIDFDLATTDLELPLTVGLAPVNDDASRTWEVRARLFASGATPIAVGRIGGGYEEGVNRRVSLLLQGSDPSIEEIAMPDGGDFVDVAVAASAPDVVYARTASGRLFSFREGDLSFRECASRDVDHLAVSPADSGRVLIARPDGVFASADGCRTFSEGSLAAPGPVLFVSEQVWLVGTADGIERVEDGEATLVAPGIVVRSFSRAGETVAAGTAGQGVWGSEDGGRSWDARNAGLPLNRRNVNDVHVVPGDPDRWYAKPRRNAFLSEDRGASWRRYNFRGFIVRSHPTRAECALLLYGPEIAAVRGGLDNAQSALFTPEVLAKSHAREVAFVPGGEGRFWLASGRGLYRGQLPSDCTVAGEADLPLAQSHPGVRAWSVRDVAVLPGATALATSASVMLSVDGRRSWSPLTEGSYNSGDLVDLEWDGTVLFQCGRRASASRIFEPDSRWNDVALAEADGCRSLHLPGAPGGRMAGERFLHLRDSEGWQAIELGGPVLDSEQSADGDVWAIVEGAVYLREAGAEAFRLVTAGIGAVAATTLHRSSEGMLLLGTDHGVFEWEPANEAFRDQALRGVQVRAMLESPWGVLLANDDGVFRRTAPGFWTPWAQLAGRRPIALAVDGEEVLVGTDGFGALSFQAPDDP